MTWSLFRQASRRTTRAFSLIEVMVSGAVLLTGLAAFVSGFTLSVHSEAQLKHITVASQIAEGVVENLLAAAAASELLLPGDHVSTNGAPLAFDEEGESRPEADAYYRATWHVTPNRAGSVAFVGVARIDVTVAWDDGQPKTTSLVFHRD